MISTLSQYNSNWFNFLLFHFPGRTEIEAKEVSPQSPVVDKFLSTQNVLPNVTTSNHNVGNRCVLLKNNKNFDKEFRSEHIPLIDYLHYEDFKLFEDMFN